MKIDKLVAFYKRYISPLNPPACRFYPTCSEYANLCFRFNNPITALAKSLIRLLKCNQLFEGGIAYPQITIDLRKFSHKIPHQKAQHQSNIFQNPQNISFWLVPCLESIHSKSKNNAKITHKFYAIKSLKG